MHRLQRLAVVVLLSPALAIAAASPKGGSTPDLAASLDVPAYPSAGTRVTIALTITNTPTADAQALVEVMVSQPWPFEGDSCGGVFGGSAPGLVEAQLAVAAGATRECALFFRAPDVTTGAFGVQARAVDPDDANGANNVASAGGTVVRLRVNTTGDLVDNAPGDGACRSAADGIPFCSVRAAILEANALPGFQRIELPYSPSPYLLTMQGAAENAFLRDLDILDSVELDGLPDASGQRPVVAASFASLVDRVVEIDAPGGYVALNDVVLAGLEAEVAGRGGVVAHRAGDLVLTGVDISGGAASERGGGLSVESNAWIAFSSVRENSSREGAGIAVLLGAGEWLEIADSEVIDNSGSGVDPNGGGLYLSGGDVRIVRSLVAFNRSDDGGGLFAVGSALTVENSTFSSNIADSNGGAAYLAFSGSAWLFSTIAHNDAAPGDDNDGLGGGIYLGPSAGAALASSILHGNSAQVRLVGTPPLQLPVPYAAACYGALQSQGYNAIQPIGQDTQCSMGAATGDSFSGASGLQALADNGGFARSHALAPGSAQIDAANPACQGDGGDLLSLDQRRSFRPHDGNADGTAHCDQGAFEFQPAAIVSVVKQGNGDGTIVSDPVGIHCGATCSAEFPAGSEVTLVPSQGAGSVFLGWVSPCTGTGSCTVTAAPGTTEVIAAYAATTADIFGDGFECEDDGSDTLASPKGGTRCPARDEE